MVRYRLFHIAFCIVSGNYSSLHADLHAADLSCTTPVVIDTTTTVILDTDVSVTDTCSLIIAGPNFGITQTDYVMFTSETNNKLVIASGGMWDPATFDTNTKRIQFLETSVLAINDSGIFKLSGPLDIIAAKLAVYRGAIIWFNNGTILNNGTIQTIATGS